MADTVRATTMQSSPPQRAWPGPSSPAESQYSLDLAALELESPRGASTPLPQLRVDQIRSEDIDGPSDFTLNMGKWMRGGTVSKREPHDLRRAFRTENGKDTYYGGDGAESQDAGESAIIADDDRTMSHHTPMNSPPRNSILLNSIREMQSHATASVGLENKQSRDKPHLQPTVEEFRSEMSLGAGHSHFQPLLRNTESIPANQAAPSPVSQNHASALGSPIAFGTSRREPLGHFSSQADEATFEDYLQQLHELETRCQQLERVNIALTQAIKEERRAREQDVDKASQSHNLHRDADIGRSGGNESAAVFQVPTTALEMDQTKVISQLREQLQLDRSEHRKQIQNLEQDLELTRLSRDNAEESARMDREELEEMRESHDAESDRMRLEVQDTQDLKLQVAELNEQIKTLQLDKNELTAKRENAENMATNLRAELTIFKQTQEEQTNRSTTDYQRAVSLSETLQAQVKELRKQLLDEQAAHDAEMERVQNGSQAGPSEASDEAKSLRNQVETQQSRLNSAVIERDSVQDELDSTRSKLGSTHAALEKLQSEFDLLQIEISDLRAVNVEMDSRLSDGLRTRESYWRERLERMQAERKIMVKALMEQWGREELGEDEPLQTYLYKYVKHAGANGATRMKA